MPTIILNKKNYIHNLEIISKQAGSKRKVAVVLKDNAYGHGLTEIASMANEFGITKAVVRTCEEAKKIKDYFKDIIVLSDTTIHNFSHTFHIVVNSMEQLERMPKNTNIHIKVDTGMHRNGISPNTLEVAIHRALKKNLNIKGVMTHLRSSDSLSCELFWQKQIFKQVKKTTVNICEKLSIPLPMFHSSNSSALFRTNYFDDDFARTGLAQYGYLDSDPIFNIPNLKPVMSLWANKVASRKILKGQKVGYGGGYIAKKDMHISTYDIGYSDGFLRLNEKHNYTTADGYKILGKVSMDNCSINSIDEKVCIFNDVRELAKIHDTISYEIMTTLNQNIKKEII